MDDILISVSARSGRRSRPLYRLLALMALGRSRQRLGGLDEHLLRDIGLSRHEARAEAERPVWNAPAHWLR